MPDNERNIEVRNFFTNENPEVPEAKNASGDYGIIPNPINPTNIVDGLTERGAGLGKLGSSMPSPLARLFLFSAALREVNDLEGMDPGYGHIGKQNEDGNYELTPYHDLVGEMFDMLEFVFKYGEEPDFHVQRWDMGVECAALENSRVPAHHQLASALRSAFEFGVLRGHPIYLFKWKDDVIGGTSPISLVYTSANLRSVLKKQGLQFTGNAGNKLFSDDDEPWPLHRRDEAFREYLYRLMHTDLPPVGDTSPLSQLSKFLQDSASTYDPALSDFVAASPSAYKKVRNLQSQGLNVRVAGVQLRVSDHSLNFDTSGYFLKPTVDFYKHGDEKTPVPMILTKYGDDRLIYVNDRKWNPGSDVIQAVLPQNIYDRQLPGFNMVTYPFLTVSDFFEDKVIEVSYDINREKFFTGCDRQLSFLLPLKKIFFDYFKVSDLFDENGKYTNMLTVEYDEGRSKLRIQLTLPLVNGNSICLQKTYNVGEDSQEKVDCYDGAKTFDMAFFPFYRLEPDAYQNVYNVMLGKTIEGVSLKFFEPGATPKGVSTELPVESKPRTFKGKNSQLSTEHIRVRGAFSYAELTVKDGTEVKALILPIFTKVNSNPAAAAREFLFSIDFGTTNTHVSYASVPHGTPFGHAQVSPFNYSEVDSQMVTFNSKEGAREFGAFTTAIKRELVPAVFGNIVKFPMRTATYQVAGNPGALEMFFNTNIGFNYGEDISRSSNYKTNIKWDRFDGLANKRMSTYFAQMLWMMKNKSVLNDGSNTFELVVTYPISMRQNDLSDFRNAWTNAMREVQCNVTIRYRTESVAPYYSYLADLAYGEPYANMDIGGGTTDFLYVNPFSGETNVFSAFFAANDLWNDGIDKVNRASKANGFVTYYTDVKGQMLGDKRTDYEAVLNTASSSADIISYLFANDSWTDLSDTIRRSTTMMQLPVIHFSALVFYMAFALHMAELDVPTNLSFTGMGSKYIKLLSSDEKSISKLVNAIFHYAGSNNVLNNSTLRDAEVIVSFAPNPKEVTAMGALISLNYTRPIIPSEDIYIGFENEDPGKTMRYRDISADVQDGVVRLFRKFTEMFRDDEVLDVLSDLGYNVDDEVTKKLSQYAVQSLRQMHASSAEGQNPNDKLKEPMFFWPLKNALYIIGKDLAKSCLNDANGKSRK